jgi:hypothetical protein
MKYPKLGLLNFEGDVLVAHKRQNLFVITDQWKEIVAIILDDELRDFIEGRTTITDSHNKEWNYVNEHQNAKPKFEVLKKFIGEPLHQIA